MPERARVQAAPVNLNAKQFFRTDVTEMDLPPKMVQQGKLAWLGRGFENDGRKPERANKPVGIRGVQASILIEQSDALRAFPGFDDELECAGIEPLLALVDPRRERPIAEPPVVF